MALLLRWFPLALVSLLAFWLRTHDLGRRPMHADEANQAVKTGELLESGCYRFDPRDHHGPTLYYATVPIAWLRGQRSLADLDEITVRLVPALFGTVAVGLIFCLALPLGRWTAFAAACFAALSPPLVYYGRFYIQETLLLTFTLATFVAARRWWHRPSLGAAVAAGICAGLMQATKSTAPLLLLAGGLALWVAPASARESRRPFSRLKPALRHALGAGAAALATCVLFYSSFFTQWGGLADAIRTYAIGFSRLSEETGHEKPWWYYLQLFAGQKNGGLLWHQLPLAALALAGFGVAFRPRLSSSLLRWTAGFTLLLGTALTLISYKTPWHAIHLVPGLAILAAAALGALARLPTAKLLAVPAALLVAGTLYQQTARAAFHRPADARNPFAYVHSAPDVLKIRALAEAARARDPEGPIRIIGEEYWPIPWYLRGLDNVGYWSVAPEACDGPLIVASVAQAEMVRERLRHAYTESILGLRPGVLLIVFTAAQ